MVLWTRVRVITHIILLVIVAPNPSLTKRNVPIQAPPVFLKAKQCIMLKCKYSMTSEAHRRCCG